MRTVQLGPPSTEEGSVTALVPVRGVATRIASTFAAGDPARPAFVFVHGVAQNATAGRAFVRFFQARNHTTVTVDLPGHGASDPWPDTGLTMARLGRVLWEVLAHWGIDGPVLACGHSAGGMAVLEATLRAPERVAGLLLVSTPDAQPVLANETLDLRPMVDMMIRDAERLFVERRRVDFDRRPGLTDEEIYQLGMKHTGATGIRQVFRAAESYDVRTRLGRVTMPCLLLRGEGDVVVDAEIASRMGRRLPRSRLIQTPGGHNWFLHRPDLLRQHLMEQYEFLTSASGRAPEEYPRGGVEVCATLRM